MTTLYTFGDSILDCANYNDHWVHPAKLIVQNDDRLFPEFAGRDLAARAPARRVHRAQDGAWVENLPAQAKGLTVEGPAVAMPTVGGNHLLANLSADISAFLGKFARDLDTFLRTLPIRPVLIGNVYDPSCGDDSRNFLEILPAVARKALASLNEVIAGVAGKHGTLVDLHDHFLRRGDLSWFTRTIEPSLTGAAEVRRCFLEAWPS